MTLRVLVVVWGVMLVLACAEETPGGGKRDSGSSRQDAAPDAAADRGGADDAGATEDGANADALIACDHGAVPSGGCACDGELFDDGFCCGGTWQPNACGTATVSLTACGLLDQAGATYRLQQDVQAEGNCFVVKGDDITLDLAGRAVRWSSPDKADWYYAVLNHPSWDGVPAAWRGGGDGFRVTNGAITQTSVGEACRNADVNAPAGNGSGTATHAIYLRGCDNCIIDHLTIDIGCHDTTGVRVRGGDSPQLHHNVIHNDVQTLTDRHFPGECSIWLDGVAGHARVYDNQILGGPHVGIRSGGSTATRIEIFRNRIAHRERYVNGYAIAAGADNLEIYDNVIEPESGRGVHITGDHLIFRDNILRIKEQPPIDQYGSEYRADTWLPAHGIKIEGGHDQKIFGNDVLSEQPSADYGPPSPLNLNSSASQGDIEIYDNTIVARTALDPATGDTGYGNFAVYAAAIQALACGTGAGNYRIHHNHFKSNDRLLYIERVTCGGLQFEDNTFELLGEATSNQHTFVLDGISQDLVLLGNRFIGFAKDDFDVGSRASVGLSIVARAEVTVSQPGGAPLEGATVSWTPATGGTPVASGTTDSAGLHRSELAELRYASGDSPELSRRNPYALRVTAAGFTTHAQSVTVSDRNQIAVTLIPQ